MASVGTRPPPTPRRFLPPDPRVEAPYRLTPQLALRIAILGALALGLFAVLFLRLWALQILQGDQYRESAQNNQLRTVRIPAPRGAVRDRDGRVLVENRPGTAVRVWPADLPRLRGPRLRELRRLSTIVHVPLRELRADIARGEKDPLTPVTVKVSPRRDQVVYIYEHGDEFRGVDVGGTFLRSYPYQAMAAQILGYVSEISPEQVKERRRQGYRAGDRIGQAGIEATYDRYLRGQPGVAQMRVDSRGRRRSALTPSQAASAGNDLRLTIDAGLQRTAEQALREGIGIARGSDCYGCWSSNGGAVIAMNPWNGEILAMASNPTYKPSLYAGRVDPKKLDKAGLLTAKRAKEKNTPALNRAIAGQYAPGSTFKPMTALAAMQEHILEPYRPLLCSPSYKAYRQTFNNWTDLIYQSMNLPLALANSCDTYFYQVGRAFYELPKDRGQPLQRWAGRLGFGKRTGVDVAGEQPGLLPTIAWRKRTFTKEIDPKHWEIDSLWKPGDSIQLAIGQKDLLVTPIQMARFYSLLANGGKLVTPHLAMDVEQPSAKGRPLVLQSFAPPAPQAIDVDPRALSVIRSGLVQATHDFEWGTSAGVFGHFPISIAGKTGTAEATVDGERRDHAWWCGFGPSDTPKLVVCAVIENGGHGGEAAAPAALRVFERFFGKSAGYRQAVNTD